MWEDPMRAIEAKSFSGYGGLQRIGHLAKSSWRGDPQGNSHLRNSRAPDRINARCPAEYARASAPEATSVRLVGQTSLVRRVCMQKILQQIRTGLMLSVDNRIF